MPACESNDARKEGQCITRLRSLEWWLLGAGVTLWVFLPRYQFTGMTGEWFALGFPWKSGAMKVGYVRSFESIGVHPHLSAGFWLNLLTWGAGALALRQLATFKNRLWPLVVARSAILVIFVSAVICTPPGLLRILAGLSE